MIYPERYASDEHLLAEVIVGVVGERHCPATSAITKSVAMAKHRFSITGERLVALFLVRLQAFSHSLFFGKAQSIIPACCNTDKTITATEGGKPPPQKKRCSYVKHVVHHAHTQPFPFCHDVSVGQIGSEVPRAREAPRL